MTCLEQHFRKWNSPISYITSAIWLKIISKILRPKTAELVNKLEGKNRQIGSRYLILLIIINVVFILFYIFMIIYANVELSNNIEDYINVHLKMKKGVIMLLLVKSNFIENKNKIDKFKYFNVWGILQSKNRKGIMESLDSICWSELSNIGSKDKNVGYIAGVESVTINNSTGSEKNIIKIS